MPAARILLFGLVLALLAGGCGRNAGGPAQAPQGDVRGDDDKNAPGTPSKEVIRAWHLDGFEFGWYGRDKSGSLEFQEGPDGLTDRVRAFRPWEREKVDRLSELPDPKVPFALDLS